MVPPRLFGILLCSAVLSSVAACGGDESVTTFLLTFENVSAPGDLSTSDGGATDVVFAPGVWAVFDAGGALFTEGAAASEGIHAVAEDGNNLPLVATAEDLPLAVRAGTFGQVDEGTSYEENPIGPGVSVEIDVTAEPGQVLSLASMFVQSNDVFVAPTAGALPFFDAVGVPVSGDVTASLSFFDAGTEVNEEPGLGLSQAARQTEPGLGADEGGTITRLAGTDSAGFAYPTVIATFRLTITPR